MIENPSLATGRCKQAFAVIQRTNHGIWILEREVAI